MGIAISSSSSPRIETAAKLIRLDGELQKFYSPVKISSLLNSTSSDSFICNSDKMEFDGFLSAMKQEEELLPGQLYFELPLTQLTRRLQAEDMSSLALKAHAAFAKKDEDVTCGCYYYNEGRNRVDPLFFSNEDYVRLNGSESEEDPILQGPACDIQFLFKNKTAKLGVILEE